MNNDIALFLVSPAIFNSLPATVYYFLFLQLLQLLKDASLGETAAEGFHILLDDCVDVMTPQMHANIKMMYRQRFFLENSPKLVEGFNHSEQSIYTI